MKEPGSELDEVVCIHALVTEFDGNKTIKKHQARARVVQRLNARKVEGQVPMCSIQSHATRSSTVRYVPPRLFTRCCPYRLSLDEQDEKARKRRFPSARFGQ